MSKFLKTIGMVSMVAMLTFSAANALEKETFTAIAKETITQALSGSISDIDGLIAKQAKLVALGVAGCQKYANSTSDPVHKKIMELVIRDAEKMKSMDLDSIEEHWHEGGILAAEGIDMDKLGQSSEVISLMDTVVHPATSYIALKEYKKSQDSDLLDQVKDELDEVLHHLEQIQ